MGNTFAFAFLSALGQLQPLLLDLPGSCFVVEPDMLNEPGGEEEEEGGEGGREGRTFHVSVYPVRLKNGGNGGGKGRKGGT